MIVWAITLIFVSLGFVAMAIIDFQTGGWLYIAALATYFLMLILNLILLSKKQSKFKYLQVCIVSLVSMALVLLDIFIFRKRALLVNIGVVYVYYIWHDTLWLFFANIWICLSTFLSLKYYQNQKTKAQRIIDLETELTRLKESK